VTAPEPVAEVDYNTQTLVCDVVRLSADGDHVIADARAVADSLETIVNTLNKLKNAGAWLGPSADDADILFQRFNSAATALFGDESGGGILPLIGGNLKVAAGNYDSGEKAIVGNFTQFLGGSGDAPSLEESGPEAPADPDNPVILNPHYQLP
jgi:hypothetical protein